MSSRKLQIEKWKSKLNNNKRFALFGKICCGGIVIFTIVIIILLCVYGIPSVPQFAIKGAMPSTTDSRFRAVQDTLGLNTSVTLTIGLDNKNKFDINVNNLAVAIKTKDDVSMGQGSQSVTIPKSTPFEFKLKVDLYLSLNLRNDKSSSLGAIFKACGYDPLYQKMRPAFLALSSLSSSDKGVFNDLSSFLSNSMSSSLAAIGIKNKLGNEDSQHQKDLLGVFSPEQQSRISSNNLLKRQLNKRQLPSLNPLGSNSNPFTDTQNYWIKQIDDLKPAGGKQFPVNNGVDLDASVVFHYHIHTDADLSIDCPDTVITNAFYIFANSIAATMNQ